MNLKIMSREFSIYDLNSVIWRTLCQHQMQHIHLLGLHTQAPVKFQEILGGRHLRHLFFTS